MKIKIQKTKLEQHLNNVIKSIDYNPPLVSLKGVYIEILKTHLIFITSDGTLSIKETVEVVDNIKVEKTGVILVPCRLLLETIKKQKNGEIILETKNNKLFIFSSNSSVIINLLDPSDFPQINFGLEGKKFKIKTDDLKKIYYDVAFAAGENNQRMILNGINFQIDQKILNATATNSYRLASKKVIIESDEKLNFTILSKNLKNFLINKPTEKIELIVNEQKINLKTGETLIQSKLLDGLYPDVTQFIPTEFKYELEIDNKKLINVIDQATVINTSNSASIRMEIIPNQNIIVETKNEQTGSSKIEINDFKWKGAPFLITYDSKFFLDAIKTFSGPIKILFNGELKPIIIKSTQKPELIQLVLPQKTY